MEDYSHRSFKVDDHDVLAAWLMAMALLLVIIPFS